MVNTTAAATTTAKPYSMMRVLRTPSLFECNLKNQVEPSAQVQKKTIVYNKCARAFFKCRIDQRCNSTSNNNNNINIIKR